MFAATLARTPDAPAVHYRDASPTFAQVDGASSALAGGLRAKGLHRGDRAGVYLQNIPEFFVATLGIWKAGGVMVPLNPMLKEQELRYELADSSATALISLPELSETVRAALPGTAVRTVVTVGEDFDELIAGHSHDHFPDPGLRAGDVAFISYTSGTTGRPKGAMNTHGNVVFNSEVFRTWLRLTPDDVILGAAPLFHITGLIAHMTTGLLAGVPVALFYRFEPGEALRAIERWRCTTTVASITAFLSMMAHPELSGRDLSSFRKVYSGGAPVPLATIERFEALTGVSIHQIYGLTETTSPSHATPLGGRGPVDAEFGALAVGLPVPDTDAKVVELKTHRELPAGELGEVWIKGPGVVPGYWQNAAATEESFTDGYLHTGDIGKMDENGWFFIVDRAKDMINVSGYKVWPREVEDFLYQHPAVRETSVVGVPDAYRGETVKAYVALKPGMTVTPEALVAFCRERMAAYKYPRIIEIVDDIPKSTSGKFLRRVLRDREIERRHAG